MIKITLVCAAGMSTSMLVSRMKEVAKSKEGEFEIKALSEGTFRQKNEIPDILLLGPQISYEFENLKGDFEPRGVKVALIDMIDYGTMNGEKVLSDALDLLK
ncbi:MAG: PTS sugar transporter subunit IIB [Lactovum sp.]